MNKCNSQSSLVSMLIRGSKKVSEVIVLYKTFFYSDTLAMFCHGCSKQTACSLTFVLKSA